MNMNPDLSAKMKRLFSNLTKSPLTQPSTSTTNGTTPSTTSRPQSVLSVNVAHKTGLQPKYLVPPVPHPCPYEHIAILATSEGLLLRPHFPNDTSASRSYVKIDWGKDGKIEEIEESEDRKPLDWSDCTVVYGVLGVLNLFSVFEETHPVYSVKGVSVIPLVESRATTVLNTLSRILTASLNKNHAKETSDGELETPVAESGNSDGAVSPPRVKFAADDQVKTMTPLSKHEFEHTLDDESSPPSPSSSIASTPSSESSPNATNVAKVLADKLSFWSRLSKRTSRSVASAAQQQGVIHEEEALESLMRGESPPPSASPTNLDAVIADGTKEPAQVLNTILQETAPPPSTTEEKHNELEDKIIRDCVREFTRGGMYFSYTFGKYHTNSTAKAGIGC
ncbi:hypothetical protein QCA50_003316 [Cerrena zonata]|uniref:Uncharacterized protein n=1 Tax=Cerrena zonata TaxID=2478898 RepID=A0AAW0GW03_9APHY